MLYTYGVEHLYNPVARLAPLRSGCMLKLPEKNAGFNPKLEHFIQPAELKKICIVSSEWLIFDNTSGICGRIFENPLIVKTLPDTCGRSVIFYTPAF